MIELSADPRTAENQVEAILVYLTALGHIDDEFDLAEKAFVRKFLRDLVTARIDAQGPTDAELRFERIEQLHEHYVERFGQIDQEVKSLLSEVVASGENSNAFVMSRLQLRCFESFGQLNPSEQQKLLDTVDAFISADGVVHPAELAFRNQLAELLGSDPVSPTDAGLPGRSLSIERPTELVPTTEDHPFFQGFEHHYSADPQQVRAQIQTDLAQLERVRALWASQREATTSGLQGRGDVAALQGSCQASSMLDRYVYAVPHDAVGDYELIVLGDLHGCYSCLKAAVMQSHFMDKVRAHRADPASHPAVRLVLLGDYIDRGRFSFNGVLRAVLKLFETVPDNVFVLRGNHEYYIRHGGRVYGGVTPSDAINALAPVLPDEVFEQYLQFFDDMPHALLFDNILFAHGGMPRDATLAERWKDLSSLNDPEIRFQMMWSDPSSADHVPDALQQASARFAFGRNQFQRFMSRIGCNLMVRGHERIISGFRVSYPRDDAKLLTLFSAGGATNDDLPEDSNYRDVRPMALTISHIGGETTVTPWAIDYRRYQEPERNGFFRPSGDVLS